MDHANRIRLALFVVLLPAWLVLANSDHAVGQGPPTADAAEASKAPASLTVDRIYRDNEFAARSYDARWLKGDSASYTTLEPSQTRKGSHDIVRHDAASGESEVMVAAEELVPPGESTPLHINDYRWSQDHHLLLIFTNTRRVWRHNSRGDYWVLDRGSRQLRRLGGDAPPASLMYAKFSPDAKQVAYVRDRDIYAENLLDHSIRRLTTAPSDEIINGTTDWVYEEELGLRDAFRWSPDGRSIAYWQLDTTGVEKFPLINQTDSLYPRVKWFAYPKVGQRNPACRVGLVDCESGETQWVDLPGDPREHYIPRMQFLPDAESTPGDDRLLIQQLNRLQNTNRLFLADFRGHSVAPLLVETDDAWVDVHDELYLIDEGRRFTWMSDRDGWRHAYVADLDGGILRLITPGEYDVVKLLKVDERRGVAYFVASPDDATERYLYRAALDGSGVTRLTPANTQGTHGYAFSPDCQYAIHTFSDANRPPVTELIATDHSTIRHLQDNGPLEKKLATLAPISTEFFRVDIGGDVELDAWCLRPATIEQGRQYPLLVYVYGEPAGATVVNRWGGSSFLWHRMLAERGYVVMSFDNRGTKAPRGRAWRKSIYKKIGILPPQDQAAAVKAVLRKRNYLDPTRVGIWGWSGGGSSSLQAIFKYPELYQTAIAVAPVPNQTYYDTIYQERYMSLPELNVEGFREGSAINFAHQLEGNLLLIHGTGDDNCHYQTTELLIDELIAHDKPFSMMAYPNRTHSIKERKNTTPHLRKLMTRYLEQHLPVATKATQSE